MEDNKIIDPAFGPKQRWDLNSPDRYYTYLVCA